MFHKVIAKKYLEDKNMTEIVSDCLLHLDSGICLMGRELIFSHYKGRERMVFARSKEMLEKDHDYDCIDHYALMKEARSRNANDFIGEDPNRCLECIDKVGGERCDLPR